MERLCRECVERWHEWGTAKRCRLQDDERLDLAYVYLRQLNINP